jgi:hypothetical protein
VSVRNLVDCRNFAALSSLNARYNMDPGAVGSRSDFEIAAKLTRARSDAVDPNPGSERRLLLLTFCAATIVSDNHVQSTGDRSQIYRHM